MMKKVLSFVLCLVMVFSLFPAFGMSAAAADEISADGLVVTGQDDSGMLNMTKTLVPQNDGTYNLKIESWATGTVSTVTSSVPSDFVLVVDQSSWMREEDIPVDVEPVEHDWSLLDIRNIYVTEPLTYDQILHINEHASMNSPNYWDYDASVQKYYKVGDDFYPVVVVNNGYNNGTKYVKLPSNATAVNIIFTEQAIDNGATFIGDAYYDYGSRSRQLYYFDGNAYQHVFAEQRKASGLFGRYTITLYYFDYLSKRHVIGTYSKTTSTWNPSGDSINNPNLYYYNGQSEANYEKYQLCYIKDGALVPITSLADQGIDATLSKPTHNNNTHRHNYQGNQLYNPNKNNNDRYFLSSGDHMFTLWVANSYEGRDSALKDAVESFVNTVAEQSATIQDEIGHRIAIVGFAGQNEKNTELMTGVGISGAPGDGVQYSNGISDTQYANALQDVSVAEQKQDVLNAVNAIDANGIAEPKYGLEMAQKILANSGDRKKVVIFFSSGELGSAPPAGNIYSLDDQISLANDTVSAAKLVKDAGAEVYSVGVFAQGDDHPLTYSILQSASEAGSVSRTNMVSYEYYGSSNGYLVFRGNKTTDTSHNDTIKDFLQCVSSRFPGAENFLTESSVKNNGGSQDTLRLNGGENTPPDYPDYYLKVSNVNSLQSVFDTVTSQSTSTVPVNENAVLVDVVKTADFDLPEGFTAEDVDAYAVTLTNDGTEGEKGSGSSVPVPDVVDGNKITVTGFNYSEKCTTTSQDGEKLIVEISGLTPKHSGRCESNSEAKILTGENGEVVLQLVNSPYVTIADTTKVVDFNAKMVLATNAAEPKNGTINNGTFGLDSSSKAFYQLNDVTLVGSGTGAANPNASDLSAVYGNSDTAMVYGKHGSDANALWKFVTVVPASNIYYSDTIKNAEVVADDLAGNANLSVTTTSASNKKFEFTFTGNRIDVYCTAGSSGGTVGAILYQGDTKVQTKMVGTKVDGTYANTPAVSFDGLNGTYKLVLTANAKSNFKLDGVRVYNNAANDVEKDVQYVILRDVLVEKSSALPLDSTTTGAAFFTDAGIMGTGDDTNPNAPGSDDYKKWVPSDYENVGPKNEIYLTNGQSVGFVAEGYDVMVGVRAPGGSGTAKLNGKDQNVTDMDLFYAVEPNADGVVFISNSTDDMISVTSVKLTAQAGASPQGLLTVSPKLMRFAALLGAPAEEETPVEPEQPVVPDQPDEPEQPELSIADLVKQIISDFVSNLFRSISRLFGN